MPKEGKRDMPKLSAGPLFQMFLLTKIIHLFVSKPVMPQDLTLHFPYKSDFISIFTDFLDAGSLLGHGPLPLKTTTYSTHF